MLDQSIETELNNLEQQMVDNIFKELNDPNRLPVPYSDKPFGSPAKEIFIWLICGEEALKNYLQMT
jgi:hypothetical protein